MQSFLLQVDVAETYFLKLTIQMPSLEVGVRQRKKRSRPSSRIREARAPTRAELEDLLDKIMTRLMRMLTGLGDLVEEQGMTYLADIGIDNPLKPLQAASCTYRIALGPRAVGRISARTSNGCAAISPAPRSPMNGSSAMAKAKSCCN